MTHYETLSVPRTAQAREIRKAYLALAQVHHPDRGGSEKRMREINEAFSTLYDPDRRKEYDAILARYGKAGPAEYAKKRYEEHMGTWSEKAKPAVPSKPEKPKYRAHYDTKEVDFIYVDGPRTIYHGKPSRQKNQTTRSRGKHSTVHMGGQDKKVREPK